MISRKKLSNHNVLILDPNSYITFTNFSYFSDATCFFWQIIISPFRLQYNWTLLLYPLQLCHVLLASGAKWIQTATSDEPESGGVQWFVLSCTRSSMLLHNGDSSLFLWGRHTTYFILLVKWCFSNDFPERQTDCFKHVQDGFHWHFGGSSLES